MCKRGRDNSVYLIYEKLRKDKSYTPINVNNTMDFISTNNYDATLPPFTNIINSDTNVQVQTNGIVVIKQKSISVLWECILWWGSNMFSLY